MPPQAPGDNVSQIESSIEQTFNLAGTIVKLVKEPIAYAWQNLEKRAAIKRSIGDWDKEAYDNERECRMPVLRYKPRERNANAFETYLIDSDGILVPGSNVPAKSCWAYLMHALGIKPGMDLVEWMPLLDGYVSTQNGGIEMEIDGAAFCTIVNLFYTDGIWDKSREQFKDPEEIKFVKLGCGDLAWAEKDNAIHAHFKPGTEKEINMKKYFFSTLGERMESGTLVFAYLNAWKYGVSDTALALPHHTAPLKERLKKFNDATQIFMIRAGPLVLSNLWLREASRIVKRALADGGEDKSFFEDLCHALEPSLTPEQKQREKWKSEIRTDFLFGNELPRYSVPSSSRTPPQPRSGILKKVYEQVLEGYKDEPAGTWKHELFLVRKEVSKLAGWGGLVWLPPFRHHAGLLSLDDEHVVWNRRVLPFDEGCSLWNRKVLLGGLVNDASSCRS